jgi:N-acyl-L-homoserine lactone synthetase
MSDFRIQLLSEHRPISIRFATSPCELSSIRRLRYSIYVEEQGRDLISANHETRELEDQFDHGALHLYVARAKDIVACVRIHLGQIPAALAVPLNLSQFRECGEGKDCFVSKLMVRQSERNKAITGRLIQSVYSIARERGVARVFCATFPHLVSFYERVGLQAYNEVYIDKELGPQYAMTASIDSFLLSGRVTFGAGYGFRPATKEARCGNELKAKNTGSDSSDLRPAGNEEPNDAIAVSSRPSARTQILNKESIQ